jgi:hypothetical protein
MVLRKSTKNAAANVIACHYMTEAQIMQLAEGH